MKFIENIKTQLQRVDEAVSYVYKFSKDSNTHFFYLYPDNLRFSDSIDEIYYNGIDQILDEGLNLDLCFTFEKDDFFSFENPDGLYEATQLRVGEGQLDKMSVQTSIKEMVVFEDDRLISHQNSNSWRVKEMNHPMNSEKSSRVTGNYVTDKIAQGEVSKKGSQVVEMDNNTLSMAA